MATDAMGILVIVSLCRTNGERKAGVVWWERYGINQGIHFQNSRLLWLGKWRPEIAGASWTVVGTPGHNNGGDGRSRLRIGGRTIKRSSNPFSELDGNSGFSYFLEQNILFYQFPTSCTNEGDIDECVQSVAPVSVNPINPTDVVSWIRIDLDKGNEAGTGSVPGYVTAAACCFVIMDAASHSFSMLTDRYDGSVFWCSGLKLQVKARFKARARVKAQICGFNFPP